MRRRWTPHGPSPATVAIFASHLLLCLGGLIWSSFTSLPPFLFLRSWTTSFCLLAQEIPADKEPCVPAASAPIVSKTNQNRREHREGKSNDPHSFFLFVSRLLFFVVVPPCRKLNSLYIGSHPGYNIYLLISNWKLG